MSAVESASVDHRRRRSQRVVLVLLGAVGVAGGAIAYDAWRQRAEANRDSTPPIATDRVYNNNEYIPGVGYYHAPAHAWFPHPFNYHDPSRGYFAGGVWQAAPWIAALGQSYPSASAVAAAQGAQRDPTRAVPGAGNFSGGAGRPEGFASGPPPAAPRPGILRGGFGLSAHPAIS